MPYSQEDLLAVYEEEAAELFRKYGFLNKYLADAGLSFIDANKVIVINFQALRKAARSVEDMAQIDPAIKFDIQFKLLAAFQSLVAADYRMNTTHKSEVVDDFLSEAENAPIVLLRMILNDTANDPDWLLFGECIIGQLITCDNALSHPRYLEESSLRTRLIKDDSEASTVIDEPDPSISDGSEDKDAERKSKPKR